MKGTKKHILHPGFKYTNSASTDIRKTIRRAYRQLEREGAVQREQEAKKTTVEVDTVIKVAPQRWWSAKK
jgi:hypothetical protein